MAERPAHFLGIGAQKAGTSWLAVQLRRHPGIWMPPLKELHYFSGQSPGYSLRRHLKSMSWNLRRVRRAALQVPLGIHGSLHEALPWLARYVLQPPVVAGYRRLFSAAPGQMVGEITPAYALLPASTIRRIRSLLPDLKLIFLLRDPTLRAWSQARMELRARALADDSACAEFLLSPRCRRRSALSRCLARWEQVFAPEQILIGFYEEVCDQPRTLMQRIFGFLGLPTAETSPDLHRPVFRSRPLALRPPLRRLLDQLYRGEIQTLARRFGGYPQHWLEALQQRERARSPKTRPAREPLVSVVVPAYNAATTLPATIQSVLAQTCQDFELIVIDDGSTDDTTRVLADVKDPRLRVLRYSNGGLSKARNRGIAACRGRYLSFLDADDLWTPDKLESQLDALAAQPAAGLAYSWVRCIDEDGRDLYAFDPIHLQGDVYRDMLLKNFIGCGSNVLLSRRLVEDVGLFDERLGCVEDWDYWIRAARRWHFSVVPRYQIYYRKRVGSLSTNVPAMRQYGLQVLARAFSQAPEELGTLKQRSLAYFHCYLAFMGLESPRREAAAERAADDLGHALRIHPPIVFSLEFARALRKLLGHRLRWKAHGWSGLWGVIQRALASSSPGGESAPRAAPESRRSAPRFRAGRAAAPAGGDRPETRHGQPGYGPGNAH